MSRSSTYSATRTPPVPAPAETQYSMRPTRRRTHHRHRSRPHRRNIRTENGRSHLRTADECSCSRAAVPIHDRTRDKARAIHRQRKVSAAGRNAGRNQRLIHEWRGILDCIRQRNAQRKAQHNYACERKDERLHGVLLACELGTITAFTFRGEHCWTGGVNLPRTVV